MDDNLLIGLFIVLIVILIHCCNILLRQPNIIYIQINNINKSKSTKHYYDSIPTISKYFEDINESNKYDNDYYGQFVKLDN